jgi:hypothetical protein
MNDIDQAPIGTGPDPQEPTRRVSRLLLLWPLAGVIGAVYAVFKYQPLDDTLLYWISVIPCLVCYGLINFAWRRSRRGKAITLPRTIWLAIGCLFFPMVLVTNGALDYSPAEQHRETVTRTILEHGRRGSIYYYLETTSWRPHHTREKIGVSERKYLDFKVGDPVIVETRKGALGIPLLVSTHWPE